MADIFSEIILEASYEDIAFPVGQEEGSPATWDNVKHSAYRRDGADCEPTGLQSRHGTMDVLLFNDVESGLFPDRYDQLVDVVRRKPIGKLVHPVEGVLTALIESIQRTTSSQERDGVRLKIQWTEHLSSDVNLLRTTEDVRNAPEAVMQQASTADTAMASAAPAGGYTSVLSVMAAELDKLESQVRTATEIEASLRSMESAVTANINSSLFAGIDGYDAVVALVGLRASILRLRPRYLPDASRIRQYVVPVTMSAWSVSLQVYGDARFASKILDANSVPDPSFIAAGSVLIILPLV